MSNNDSVARIWELMQEIGVCMVVTHCDDGLRARPMGPRPDNDDDAIYFLTDADAPKDREIVANSEVCLVFCDMKQQRYVSLTGTAEVFADAEVAGRIWTESDQEFWKDANDPRIRVIRVTPQQGQFWQGAGLVASFTSMFAREAMGEPAKRQSGDKVAM